MSLSKSDIQKFKHKLEEIRKELIHEIGDAYREVKKPDESKGYSQHSADEGTEDFEKAMLIEESNNELTILRQVDRALEKIEEGTYGVCDVSGEQIPKARLEVVPYATMTVKAQEQMEKKKS